MAIKEMPALKLEVERLQTRVATNSQYIDELVEAMKAGVELPPIKVVTDGTHYWLADGIHRLDAAIQRKSKILVDLIRGDRVKAVEIACGANQEHGMRRSNQDKRRAVTMALKEFPRKSDRAIAALCGVGKTLVHSVRGEVVEKTTCRSRTGKDGKNYPAAPKKPKVPSPPATDFDPEELDSQPSAPTKKPKPGKPTVSPRQRKDCHKHLGGLIRSLQSVGVYDEFIQPLSQIAERLKQI